MPATRTVRAAVGTGGGGRGGGPAGCPEGAPRELGRSSLRAGPPMHRLHHPGSTKRMSKPAGGGGASGKVRRRNSSL